MNGIPSPRFYKEMAQPFDRRVTRRRGPQRAQERARWGAAAAGPVVDQGISGNCWSNHPFSGLLSSLRI